ncbi:YeeE/YedE family protein [uncultured Nitrosomonas sp.]|uniref:YeeE/YedE family protein n=1 Tax=uncultured Nitrosomonas sp. TaxID=156424 RepID=UPI00262BB1B9|nr:YeeE/YedE family protein [uncultured Nitrosomonas sp.]MBE7527378.1 YeeE/YedE family protein [Burkholderiales bacterium]
MIDWQSFTPISAFGGGMVIGLATALLLLVAGRIAGISGIVGGLIGLRKGDFAWRAAFVGGLLLAPWLWRWLGELPPVHIETGHALLALAGLVVGIGTRYGSGCTSGHGVCGLSRLSPRSMVATVLFMSMGMAVVYFIRHSLG